MSVIDSSFKSRVYGAVCRASVPHCKDELILELGRLQLHLDTGLGHVDSKSFQVINNLLIDFTVDHFATYKRLPSKELFKEHVEDFQSVYTDLFIK